MITQKGTVKNINNGDQVIAFMDSTKVNAAIKAAGGFDYPTITSFYNEDVNRNHRGLMTLWGDQATIKYNRTNILQDLYMKGDVIEVNGWQGKFTYDLPMYDFKGCYVTRDTSDQVNAGIDGDLFKLVLNKAYTAGDRLTADKQNGQEIIVSGFEPVVAVTEGFEHTVTLVTQDKKMTYNPKYLVKGVQYKKIGHAIDGERGTNFSSIDMPDTVGTMKCEFSLGAFSGVEAFMTGKADSTSFKGGDAKSMQYLDMLAEEFGEDNKYALLAPLVRGADGTKKPDYKNMKLGATLQYLTMRELEKITANRLMWGQAGTVQGTNGVMKMNEGFWRQLRRGKVIQYARPGGITRAHVAELGNYVFKTNPGLPIDEREIVLEGGRYAVENILEIFKDEVTAQLTRIAPLLGADALVKGAVTGDLMNLRLNQLRFTTVPLPGIGNVKIVENPSLNFDDESDRFARGIHSQGMAHSAHSIIIFDAKDKKYSNNSKYPTGVSADKIRGAKLMNGGKNEANVHLVKPEGEMLYFGYTNGRYDYTTSSQIMSGGAIKQIGQEFWCFQVCDIHVSDASRFAMLELDPSAKKGFN